MNTFFSSFNVLNSLRALALTGSLLTVGCDAETEPDPVEPAGPAPLNTILPEDLAEHTDGCLYGTAAYSLSREDTGARLIVAMQTSCPANYFIEGSCSPRLGYPDATASHNASPLLDGVCFNPQVSADRGIEPCQLGALLCAVNAPGDRVETTTDYSGDGEQTTSTETIYGPNLIDLEIFLRCCPSGV